MNGLFYLIQFALHLLVALGIWLMVKPLLKEGIRLTAQRMSYRLDRRKRRPGQRAGIVQGRKPLPLITHLDRLLYFTRPNDEPGTAAAGFILASLLLALVVFLSGLLAFRELPGHLVFRNPFLEGVTFDGRQSKDGAWRLPLFLALLTGILPYLRVRYIYAHNQVKGSYNLLDAVKIAAKYTHLPVDALLSRTADSLEQGNVLIKPLKLLSGAFANYSNEFELVTEAQRFAGAVGTTFAVEFVSDLLYCEREGGFYLKHSLLMLTRSMEQQLETILTVKANSRDAISLGLYGNLVVLFFSVGTFIYMLKPAVYFHLQFETKAGLTFLVVILSGLFLSYVISSVLSKPKLDYH